MLFGPTLAAMYTQCAVSATLKNSCIATLSFWQWGIGGDFTFPRPRFQAVGLAIHKRETWSMLVYRIMLLGDFYVTPTDVGVRDTCPRDTLIFKTNSQRGTTDIYAATHNQSFV